MKIAPLDVDYALASARRLSNGLPVSSSEFNSIISSLAIRSDMLLGGSGRKAIVAILPNNIVGNARIVGEVQPDLDQMLLDDSAESRRRTEAALYLFDVASALRSTAYASSSAHRPSSPTGYAAVYGPFADKIIDNPNVFVLTDPQEAEEAVRILSTGGTELLLQRDRYLPRAYGRSSVAKVLKLGVSMGGGLLVALSLAYVIAGRKLDARKEAEAQEKSFGISRMG